MKLSVRLFAGAREAAGADSIEVEVARHPTAARVISAIVARGPDPLAKVARRSRLAVNEALAAPDRAIEEGDSLALIPPVGGG